MVSEAHVAVAAFLVDCVLSGAPGTHFQDLLLNGGFIIHRYPGGALSGAIAEVAHFWAADISKLDWLPHALAEAGICQVQRSWVDVAS